MKTLRGMQRYTVVTVTNQGDTLLKENRLLLSAEQCVYVIEERGQTAQIGNDEIEIGDIRQGRTKTIHLWHKASASEEHISVVNDTMSVQAELPETTNTYMLMLGIFVFISGLVALWSGYRSTRRVEQIRSELAQRARAAESK